MFTVKIKYPKMCGGSEYMLSSRPDKFSMPTFKNHYIEKGSVVVVTSTEKGKVKFYVLIKQTKSLTYASVQFIVDTTNELPDWTETLLTTHDIPVTIGKDGKLVEPQYYYYTSPKLKDPDGHSMSIQMSASEDVSSWLTIVISTSADQFTVTVNRNKFSAPGQKQVNIMYGDLYFPKEVMKTITFNIKYLNNAKADGGKSD